MPVEARLLIATIIVAICAAIVLVVLVPVRMYFRGRDDQDESRNVPGRYVLLWVGGPIAIVYGFAIDPRLGAAFLVAMLLGIFLDEIVTRTRMTAEERKGTDKLEHDIVESVLRRIPKWAWLAFAALYLLYLLT